jgi:2-polyprenyl-6-methoxyphenol hydroxylase-like FAD-dependent oxidoreductase
MGVTKAAEDAVALAECIARHGANPAAADAYQELRLAVGQAVVRRGRDLGAYMQSQGMKTAAAPEVRRDAETVLRQTAVDLALAGVEEMNSAE